MIVISMRHHLKVVTINPAANKQITRSKERPVFQREVTFADSLVLCCLFQINTRLSSSIELLSGWS